MHPKDHFIDERLICPACKEYLQFEKDKYICLNCNISYPIIEEIFCFLDRNSRSVCFDAEMFKFLCGMEKRHFWHIGRKEMIYQMLKNCVNGNIRNIKMLEIGCGNGRVLQYLSKKGVNIEGADISIDALKFCKGQVNTLLYQTDALKIPFPKESYDVIGMFDLMEHIEDDRSLLNEVFRICKKNGKVIISVPANKFLWSYFDVLSGHKRRYTKNELIFKLERAGFKINRISFFMFFLFPIYLIFRRISIFRICNKKQDIKKLTEVKTIPLINKIFLIIFRIENLLLTQFNLPYGTSLILVAEKIN